MNSGGCIGAGSLVDESCTRESVLGDCNFFLRPNNAS